jgi:hypothetical protein
VVGKAVFIAHYALRSWRGFGTAEGRSADDLSKRPS